MSLQFCPVCKKLLQIKEKNDKIIGYCSCGFKRTCNIELSSKESILKKEKNLGIINDESDLNQGIIHKCSKCGNEFADMLDLGDRLLSESNVYLYKCKKCNHVDRETDGIGRS
jgi:DNA-directed RNA polymerase subunit M/transcription elongation factor TFIIS